MYPEYCVLMSVYHGEKAEFFEAACESMLAQTVKPSQFVLVCDGRLTDELEKVISGLEEKCGSILEVVRLKEQQGLAKALNAGLERCRYEFVARMDSDDISYPRRCACQLTAMQRRGADICSAALSEFESDPSVTVSYKTVPRTHKEILRYARTRNPFNHPCVMFRLSAVRAAGGYEDYRFFEDYNLWVRMLRNGAVGYNLRRPLLHMRTGSGMFRRRGGWNYLRCAKKMEDFKLSAGFCSRYEYIKRMSAFCVFCLIPVKARERLYKALLRRKEFGK